MEHGFGRVARDGVQNAELAEHGGHHILAEGILVEIVGPDGDPVPPGERGEIV